MSKTEPFERHATEYDNWFINHRFAYESELEAVRQHILRGRTGLEIGLGTGRFAAPLGMKLGLEPSARMGEVARKRGIEVVAGIAEAIPFRDSTLDFALMVTTICFLDDLECSLREAHRILKLEGSLIIGFIDRTSPLGQSYERHKESSTFYRGATFYTVAEVISTLKKTDFREFTFSQTIFRDLPDIDSIEPVRPGYGKGSFVVIGAEK
jgi:SAM-dependent methyltransferase